MEGGGGAQVEPETLDSPRQFWRDALDGSALAALIGLIVVAERLDVARATVEMTRNAGREDQAADTTQLAVLWGVTATLGLIAAVWVTRRVVKEAQRIGRDETRRTRLEMQAMPDGPARDAATARADLAEARTTRRVDRLKKLAALAIAAWGIWQLWGIGAVADGWPQGPRELLHVLALVLALVAIGGAGAPVLGDPGHAWRRASAVRLQLILLGLLFVLVFVVPLTAAQLVDVLRGWGEQPGTRPVVGLAGALVLGAVCRASALRLLTDTSAPTDARKLVAKVLFVGIAALMVALAVLQAWVGAATALFVLAIAFATKWRPPPAIRSARPPEADRLNAQRLAGTLGVFALGTVYVGLVDATVDSWLLPDRAPGANAWLLALTLATALLFGVLAGAAQRGATGECGPDPNHMRGVIVGAVAFILTLLAAFGPVLIAHGDVDFLWALPLLAGAVILGLRGLGDDGDPELWSGAGVAVATALAVYAEPIRVPRTFGAFGIVLICAAGLLVVLHGAASWSTRREPKGRWNLLPKRVPVVTLLAIWVAAAFAFSQDTAHQVPTIESTADSPALKEAVRTWLDREGGERPPEYLPMLLVAASGGGAKAAYWTDLVMDCVLGDGEPDASGECGPDRRADRGGQRFGRLFLTSSVSGGSIGVFHLLRNRDKAANGSVWVDAAAGTEVLSPVVAWGLFHDLPAFLIGADTDPRDCTRAANCRVEADRALVQEAAIARQTEIAPGPEMEAPMPQSPVAVFNSALDGADGRVLASPLSLAPPRVPDPSCDTDANGEPGAGSLDARDVLDAKHQDLPMLAAASISARFPVVEPAGRVGDTTPEKGAKGCHFDPPLPPVQVRDGGYIENTGLLTITDLLPQIDAVARAWAAERSHPGRPVHVQMIVLSIDDDPAVVDPEPKLEERRRQSLGISKRAGTGYLSRMARNRLTTCQYRDVTYRRISPPPHIGAHAATGWELSGDAKERDLRRALRPRQGLQGDPNQVIEWLQHVLDGDRRSLGCVPQAEKNDLIRNQSR